MHEMLFWNACGQRFIFGTALSSISNCYEHCVQLQSLLVSCWPESFVSSWSPRLPCHAASETFCIVLSPQHFLYRACLLSCVSCLTLINIIIRDKIFIWVVDMQFLSKFGTSPTLIKFPETFRGFLRTCTGIPC